MAFLGGNLDSGLRLFLNSLAGWRRNRLHFFPGRGFVMRFLGAVIMRSFFSQ